MAKPASWFSEHERELRAFAKKDPYLRMHSFSVKQGTRLDPAEFVSRVRDLGYERASGTTTEPGTFWRKGGVVEVFPMHLLAPVRFEFFGNSIANILQGASSLDEKERTKLLKRRVEKRLSFLNSLVADQYLVHEDHGIGIFKGTSAGDLPDGTTQEMAVLEYAAPRAGALPDRLFVPLEFLHKVTPYLGFTTPTLHRLGSEVWRTQKRRAREDVVRLARELLLLYTERAKRTRAPLATDETLLSAFDASFEHEETLDQTRAWRDVREDLSAEEPMDRIIVGDVGFGKTEIALRAAFAAAQAGFQTALLAPTTVLADQHAATFKARLAPFGVEIALLSRLESKTSQQESLARIERGTADVIIGTHRLLSRDVAFKNLRLLIVDEEQRFGVRHKEKLKGLKYTLDVLSLSATPIPRTLYLALGSFRDMSVIETPPPNRTNVETLIAPWDEETAKEALEKELSRGGQVFWLHNRIETLERTADLIRRLAPRTSVATAHGKLNEQALRDIMCSFREGRTRVLLATTLIENGLDLPNANTLIVDGAERLGLGQTWQLRGRVGRSHEQGFAYFFHAKHLTDVASSRLRALAEASKRLGAGFELAKRDLELRGAGNVLGKEQSGVINQVGFNLYCQMLNEAAEELKQQKLDSSHTAR